MNSLLLTVKLDSVLSNLIIFALHVFLFLFNSHYLKKGIYGPGP